MIEQTPLVLIFLITKPVFLLLVVWIVVWRSRHQMTSEMLPYSSSTRKPEALPASHPDAPALQFDADREDVATPHPHHDGTTG